MKVASVYLVLEMRLQTKGEGSAGVRVWGWEHTTRVRLLAPRTAAPPPPRRRQHRLSMLMPSRLVSAVAPGMRTCRSVCLSHFAACLRHSGRWSHERRSRERLLSAAR